VFIDKKNPHKGVAILSVLLTQEITGVFKQRLVNGKGQHMILV